MGSDSSLSAPESSQRNPPPPSIPGYVIEDVLGRGGMGVVYRAHEKATAREVALKWLPAHASATARQRFNREARAAAKLHHENIVTIHTAGTTPTGDFLVMELVDGVPLSTILERRTLPPAEIARLVGGIARGLACAHAAGVIHRDVKPSNVIVDPGGVPRIVDFGLAQFSEREGGLTGANAIMGTVLYLAPEVVSEGADRARTPCDVYSLGAVLYEALAGAPPHFEEGMALVDLLSRIGSGTPPPLPSGTPPALARLCAAALAKAPEARPTAAAMAASLEAFETTATPASRPRSHRRVLMGASLALLLGAASALIASHFLPESHPARPAAPPTPVLDPPSPPSPPPAPAPAAPIPTVPTAPSSAPAAPVDAHEILLRGTESLAVRGQEARIVSETTAVIEAWRQHRSAQLDVDITRILELRGVAYERLGKFEAADEDFTAEIALGGTLGHMDHLLLAGARGERKAFDRKFRVLDQNPAYALYIRTIREVENGDPNAAADLEQVKKGKWTATQAIFFDAAAAIAAAR